MPHSIYSYTLFKLYGTQLAAVLQIFKSCHKIQSPLGRNPFMLG